MDWKTSLDKYLMAEPYTEYDVWVENVINAMSDEFYNNNEDWIMSTDCNMVLFKLWCKCDYEIEDCVMIIERIFNIFYKNAKKNI